MLEPGQQIDIWVVEKRLGSGGMGSVYRCHNRNAPRIKAAVKVLEVARNAGTDAEARFIREAEILFQLDHPSIVKVRNIRTDHDPPYLEMEFVEGEALEDTLQRGPLELELALDRMEQASSALAYLHARGIRHRDIKPANLLLANDGHLKLVDFGLAVEAGTSRITQNGMAFGTVSYAPPEWVDPERLEPSAWDIYALGVVFWEMITGEVAFAVSGQGSARQQAMQVIVGKQNHEPLDPGEEFPAGLRSLIREMTHSDPDQRLQGAREVWIRCQALMDGSRGAGVTLAPHSVEFDTHIEPKPMKPLAAPPTADLETLLPNEGSRRRRGLAATVLLAGVGFLVTLGVAGAVGLWWALAREAETPAAETRRVEVAVQGLPDTVPIEVMLGHKAGMSEAMTFHFQEIPIGSIEVTWVIGEACPQLACPSDDCPVWCTAGHETLEITAGEGTQTLRLKLVPPAPREVTLTGSPKTIVTVGAVAATPTEAGVRLAIVPGRYAMVATLGSCEPKNQGCTERADCPPGCASSHSMVEVPVGSGPLTLTLPIAEPTPGVERPDPVPVPEPSPQAKPEPAAEGATGPPITNGQLATWLEAHPDYAPGGRMTAKGPYLKSWTGLTPPPGTESHPVSGVSAHVAARYCISRGKRLPAITDDPTDPPEMEFRVGEDRQFLVLDVGGGRIPAYDVTKATTLIGFRCTR